MAMAPFILVIEVPDELLIGDTLQERRKFLIDALNDEFQNSQDPILCFAFAEPLVDDPANFLEAYEKPQE